MATIEISQTLLKRIEMSVQAGYPYETCGILIGKPIEGGIRVHEAIEAPNLNRERPGDRYELDPKAMLTADHDARSWGLEIVGIWHTHPDHPAQPSETDRASAWEGWSYMIFSVTRDGITEARSWRLAGGQFVEERIRS
jgi:proteasome lid subunit RPN8/RPN11